MQYWSDFDTNQTNFSLWGTNSPDSFSEKNLTFFPDHYLRKPESAIFIGNFIGNVTGSFL